MNIVFLLLILMCWQLHDEQKQGSQCAIWCFLSDWSLGGCYCAGAFGIKLTYELAIEQSWQP